MCIDDDLEAEMIRYYAARAQEYDNWYLRLGRYSHGAESDAAWRADLERARVWLDGVPMSGDIVELAAGSGWWSPVLAARGSLSLYDTSPEPLAFARSRLETLGLRAQFEVRDAWSEPDRPVGGLFAGFWLSHVASERLAEFMSLAHRWLAPGGTFAFIDSRPDPESSASNHLPPEDGIQTRRLEDGTTFRVRKVFHGRDELETALRTAGFTDIDIVDAGRFFVTGSGRA
jgi:demethylmenaquinone methyltransferase/2-methoxy-6-polyprenyl-1,4-benzoquinol methylase